MRTLLMQGPSYDGYDGGAGARYQSKREVRSFWYPTWLAQPTALIDGAKLIDAPPHRLGLDDVLPQAKAHDLLVLHTSTPSFASDIRTAEAFKSDNSDLLIGLVGPKAMVDPQGCLGASTAVDFVARAEYDFTLKEIAEGRDLASVAGISWRARTGAIVHNEERAVLTDMDRLPFVSPVYARDLVIENYFSGYLRHPYLSFYTGRGCKSRCTFCLWPQTIAGHKYRVRSVGHVMDELRWAVKAFPQVREFFFDDDTLTDDLPRVEALAREIGKLGIVWSANAKGNVPRATLKVMRDNGLRLLVVGYESGNQRILHNIKKGMRIDVLRRFTRDCHDLGITIHGTFVLGLPGETRETIEQTIRFATEIDPHTIQVSLAAPYPGTYLYAQALERGWLLDENLEMLREDGVQAAAMSYPHLAHTEIFASVEDFYRRFYLRAPKIASIVGEMITSPQMMKRRLREGVEFFRFLRERKQQATAA
jgi:hopanoid biosynthesis associated radical SAM protein HpnJ